jgi:DNA-binding MarR family transcriptional regulator
VLTKNATPFVLSAYLPYKITVAAQMLSDGFSKRYREKFGISIAEWRVLVHVSDAGSVSIRDIHQRVNLDKPKASRAASKLQNAGYLVKSANSEDGRLIALTLTPKGEKLMEALLEIAFLYQEQIDATLGDTKDGLYVALDRIIASDL